MTSNPLFTDLYQLTMLAGYFKHGLLEKRATFDLYFRRAPFWGSYAIFAGLENALEYLEHLRFSDTHLEYLKGLKMFLGVAGHFQNQLPLPLRQRHELPPVREVQLGNRRVRR